MQNSKNIQQGRRIVARFQVEGIHCWPDCPIEEVAYLKDPHRHMFHIECVKPVFHDDRDIEFIQFSHTILDYLNDKYYSETHKCLQLGSLSCEQIAQELFDAFDLIGCQVLEDGESGSRLGVM